MGLGFFIPDSHAQGLCIDPAYEAGNFDLNTTTVCLPGIVSITDQSGGTDIKYIFDYQNQNLEEALSQAQASTTFDYSSFAVKPKTFTVMQIGKKNGKTMIACKKINVKKGNSVVYGYSICNIGNLEINVPVDPINDYDKYKVTIFNPFTVIDFQKNDIPKKLNFVIGLNTRFKIEGIYNDASKNCNGNIDEEILPFPNFTGMDYPYNPNIDEIELTSLDKARLTFSGPTINDNDPDKLFNLYKYVKGSPITYTPAIKDIKPGNYEITLDNSSLSYCFFVQREKNSCNLKERSAEICTNPINPVTGISFTPPSRINLSWEKYPNTIFGQVSTPPYSFNHTQKIQKIERKIQQNNIPVGAFSTQYSDLSVNCKNEYCYRIVREVSGFYNPQTSGNFFPLKFKSKSISNQVCFDGSKQKPVPITDLWVDTEPTNQNRIFFKSNTTWPLAKSKFYLLKQNNGNYKIIDSTLNNSIFNIQDDELVTKSESYKIQYKDICNALSDESPEMASIFLKSEDNQEIEWTNTIPFSQNNIQNYNILFLDENNLNITDSVSQPSNLQTFVPDISRYESKAPLRLSAVSGTVPPRYSHSNTITIPIFQRISLPNVFTPNGDGKNDTLKIIGGIYNKNVISFKMEIFDRFGSTIYSFDENNPIWDGRVNKKILTTGIYFYRINAKFKNGEIMTKNGMLEILH